MSEQNEIAIGSFEATKHSYRQTAKGVIISFLVHPENIQAQFAAMPLGEIIKIFVVKPDIGV